MWGQLSNLLTGGGGGLGPGGHGRFQAEYQCFSVSLAGKQEMERGNKILLPPSALQTLARLHISWPMLFEITNPTHNRHTHSGVLEFICEEGMCHMPYWMMQNLLIHEGDIVKITNTSLPKGTFVRLQPVTKDFLDISNPRAVLENALRNFATLTVGDNIVIDYCDHKYEIEIVELRPAPAVTIIETDVEVEFQAPKDYVEPVPEAHVTAESNAAVSSDSSATDSTRAQTSVGRRLDGKAVGLPSPSPPVTAPPPPEIDEPWRLKLPGGVRVGKHSFIPWSFGGGSLLAQLRVNVP
eukprot:GHVT01082498.1.p1 GENE.GHVT01082498.1~~GHVT01082498.1.p1  ORF type:complete len:296 (+),score=19.64 GHVT01082498.1:563-1450(+)